MKPKRLGRKGNQITYFLFQYDIGEWAEERGKAVEPKNLKHISNGWDAINFISQILCQLFFLFGFLFSDPTQLLYKDDDADDADGVGFLISIPQKEMFTQRDSFAL